MSFQPTRYGLTTKGFNLQDVLDTKIKGVVMSRAPGTSDGAEAGYNVNDIWLDSSVNPKDFYICASNTNGAAVWSKLLTNIASLLDYKGTWDAETNDPTLTNASGTNGDFYICIKAGSVNFGSGLIPFLEGDFCAYGNGQWSNLGDLFAIFSLGRKSDPIASIPSGEYEDVVIVWAVPFSTSQYIPYFSYTASTPVQLFLSEVTHDEASVTVRVWNNSGDIATNVVVGVTGVISSN